jgi:hypothetical protein
MQVVMPTIPRIYFRSALAALVLASASAAWAAIGPDQAAAIAAQTHGGRVLAVERAGGAWRVKLVTAKGEVRVVLIDAASGRPL